MRTCSICLGEIQGGGSHHATCLKRLFGTTKLPTINVDLAKFHTFALATVGHTSVSGVQRKLSLELSADRRTLQVAVDRGRYLLKPQATALPALPENEHLTMEMARASALEAPRCGIVPLADGSPAYIVARFDRPASGGKLRQEDFCQLAEKPPKEKYDGSAELCVRLLRQYASEPLIEILKLYRVLLFSWFVGDGDMHLKNFSLLTADDGIHRLAPVYDQLSTKLVIEDDQLALPICGKQASLTRQTWLDFATYCDLPRRAAERALGAQRDALPDLLRLVERSLLPDEMKAQYEKIVRTHARLLTS